MARSDKVATLEEAKAQFETAWRQWLGVGEAAGSVVAPCVSSLELRLRLQGATCGCLYLGAFAAAAWPSTPVARRLLPCALCFNEEVPAEILRFQQASTSSGKSGKSRAKIRDQLLAGLACAPAWRSVGSRLRARAAAVPAPRCAGKVPRAGSAVRRRPRSRPSPVIPARTPRKLPSHRPRRQHLFGDTF